MGTTAGGGWLDRKRAGGEDAGASRTEERMRRVAAIALLLLAGCQIDTTPEEKRWSSLEGAKVFVVSGYSEMVHGSQNCQDLQAAQGKVQLYRVSGGRLVDDQGLFAGSPREKPPLCNKCVR
jgi:hypothetical protein